MLIFNMLHVYFPFQKLIISNFLIFIDDNFTLFIKIFCAIFIQ